MVAHDKVYPIQFEEGTTMGSPASMMGRVWLCGVLTYTLMLLLLQMDYETS